MRFRILMIAVGTLAVACNANIQLGTDDGGNPDDGGLPVATRDSGTTDAHEEKRNDASADGGSTSALVLTYCSFTSDAGAPTCLGYAPWTPSASETAQAQLNCVTVHGSMVTLCPTEGLAGCCSLPLCKPLPPGGGSEVCAFTGQEQPGLNVTCSYDEDGGVAHVTDLECVAAGGTWTTTVPQ